MSLRSKHEMIEAIRPSYLKAKKTEKEQILDELIATTGYYCKYAIRVLKHSPKPKGLHKPGRRKVYQGEVVQDLEKIWGLYGQIAASFCPKGLAFLSGVGNSAYRPRQTPCYCA